MSKTSASNNVAVEFLKELESEAASTRKCLERIPFELFGWKPHDKSMKLGDLAQLVADIPRWITFIIEHGEIDFAKYPYFQPKSAEELVTHFNESLIGAGKSLKNATEESLSGDFVLMNQGKVLASSPKKDTIGQTINHMVHHRGQLTVYMRMNEIPVPSIYGPSADERVF